MKPETHASRFLLVTVFSVLVNLLNVLLREWRRGVKIRSVEETWKRTRKGFHFNFMLEQSLSVLPPHTTPAPNNLPRAVKSPVCVGSKCVRSNELLTD